MERFKKGDILHRVTDIEDYYVELLEDLNEDDEAYSQVILVNKTSEWGDQAELGERCMFLLDGFIRCEDPRVRPDLIEDLIIALDKLEEHYGKV